MAKFEKRKVTYDQGCYDLARIFLEDFWSSPPEEIIDELAQEIQSTIEDFIAERKIVAAKA